MHRYNVNDDAVLREPIWVEEPATEHHRAWRRLDGIWLRYQAGCASLHARAHLGLEVHAWGRSSPCSHYGDTDQVLTVSLGSPLESFTAEPAWGRTARFEGTLTLHRTVGRNAEWRLRGVVAVRSSLQPEEVTVFALQPEEEAYLCERAVGELAAQAAEAAAYGGHVHATGEE